MNPKFKKLLILIPIFIFLGYIVLDWSKIGGESYEEAGTDFTKSFNSERIKMNLPIIPENWTNTNPLDYKIQTWENSNRELPYHSEKTVVATYETAEFEREIDRYNLKKIGDKFYQVVIKYSKPDDKWTCTLRETNPPVKEGKGKGLRSAGTILTELTLEQASDTLKQYGIERLNY